MDITVVADIFYREIVVSTKCEAFLCALVWMALGEIIGYIRLSDRCLRLRALQEIDSQSKDALSLTRAPSPKNLCSI